MFWDQVRLCANSRRAFKPRSSFNEYIPLKHEFSSFWTMTIGNPTLKFTVVHRSLMWNINRNICKLDCGTYVSFNLQLWKQEIVIIHRMDELLTCQFIDCLQNWLPLILLSDCYRNTTRKRKLDTNSVRVAIQRMQEKKSPQVLYYII